MRRLLLLLLLLPAAAGAEGLAACRGVQASASRPGQVERQADGLAVSQRGGLRLWSLDARASFSAELGILLEAADGSACRVSLPADEMLAVALRGSGRWQAVEAGLCSKADGSCTPVRVELR